MAMNWQALGGIGQGITLGLRDLQQEDEFQFQKAQRERVLREQRADDDLEAQVRGAADEKALEEVYRRSGRTKDLERASALRRDRMTAEQMQQMKDMQQYQFHQKQVLDTVARARGLLDVTGPQDALKYLSQAYEKFPDGKKLVVQDSPSGLVFGRADASGRWVEAPQLASKENVARAIDKALDFGSYESYQAARDHALKSRQVTAAERGADAQYMNAQTAAGLAPAHARVFDAQAGYYNRMPRDGVGRVDPAQAAKDKIDEYAAILMAANPGMKLEDARKQAAGVILRDPNAKTPNDVGIAEAGLIRVGGQLYERDKEGWKPVVMPGDLKTLGESIKANLPQRGVSTAGDGGANAGAERSPMLTDAEYRARYGAPPASFSERLQRGIYREPAPLVANPRAFE